MGTFLRIVGVLWLVLGIANIVGLDWDNSAGGANLLAFGVIFNVVLFVVPAAILLGIGSWLSKKSAVSASAPAERLKNLDCMLSEGTITQDEYDAKRAEIVKSL